MLFLPLAHATNVLVIIADDLGADKVGLFAEYGDDEPLFLPSTPNLDALAAEGLAFTEAWANPLCSATRVSFMTGDFPFHTGVGYPIASGSTSGPMLDVDDTTLPEELRDAGYATAWIGKWHMGSVGSGGTATWESTFDCNVGATSYAEDPNPLRQGFDYYVGWMDGEPDAYHSWQRVEGTGDGTGTVCVDNTNHPDEYIAAEAASWIGAQTQPWFAVVAFSAPHSDGTGGAGTFEVDDIPPSCTVTIDACVESGACGDRDRDTNGDDQDLLYGYLVECLDAQVGALVEEVVDDDTIVIFFGDNGSPGTQQSAGAADVMEPPYTASFSPSTGSGRWGKGTTFRSGARVPFIVAGAGVARAGRTVERPILVVDLYETILDLVDVEPSTETDGASFADCLTNRIGSCDPIAPGERPHYTEVFDNDSGAGLTAGRFALRGSTYTMMADYDRSFDCLDTAMYANDDVGNVTDLNDEVSNLVKASFRRTIHYLGAAWMPTTRSGLVDFCD